MIPTATLNHGGRMAHNDQEWEESDFEITSKRRKGFPSETQVKRGVRIVHGNKELSEKLGRKDLCRCGSGRRFYYKTNEGRKGLGGNGWYRRLQVQPHLNSESARMPRESGAGAGILGALRRA